MFYTLHCSSSCIVMWEDTLPHIQLLHFLPTSCFYHSGGISNTDYLSGFEILQVTCTWVNTKAIKIKLTTIDVPNKPKTRLRTYNCISWEMKGRDLMAGNDNTCNLWLVWFHLVCVGEQGWCSGESTRLPPMWARFDSRTRRHMWVEFVVSSLLCSERFFSGYFLRYSSKTNTSKFQFDLECCLIHGPLACEIGQPLLMFPSLNKIDLIWLIEWLVMAQTFQVFQLLL